MVSFEEVVLKDGEGQMLTVTDISRKNIPKEYIRIESILPNGKRNIIDLSVDTWNSLVVAVSLVINQE